MPTALSRIQVTATPAVARALQIAENEWPGLPRSEQLARLAELGAGSVQAARTARRLARRRALQESRGTIDYPPGYLEDLRKEWPE